MLETIFLLLIIFQVKHFLCDYPLQNSYMLRKFLPGRDFIMPLAAHAGVHAVCTFLIVLPFKPAMAIFLRQMNTRNPHRSRKKTINCFGGV